MKQTTFVSLAFEQKKKPTRRELFLAEMEAVSCCRATRCRGRRWRALYEIESMHSFARLELSDDARPDETTIFKVRHLLERHGLSSAMMNVIKRLFGYTKVRYRELAKNAAQVFSLIGLTKLYLARWAMMN